MSDPSWSDVSLEGVGCVVLLVVAYKLYRMQLSTSSDCCGGAVHVTSENPGNETPPVLKNFLGGAEKVGRERSDSVELNRHYGNDLELGLTMEEIQEIKKSRLHRMQNVPLGGHDDACVVGSSSRDP